MTIASILASYQVIFVIYSETCIKRPPQGPRKHGPYTQVVFIRRLNGIESIRVYTWGPKNVVVISRWSLYTGGL